jgi:hypothetical protein
MGAHACKPDSKSGQLQGPRLSNVDNSTVHMVLPCTLTTLCLTHVSGTSEMDFSAISWPTDLSYLDIGLDSDPSDGYKRLFERLPRTLAALTLHHESRCKRQTFKGISNQDIPFLPRGLLELDIPLSPNLTIASRLSFPPHLKSLPF